MTKKEIEQARTQDVVKSNEIIRKGSFFLTAQQQKIILYIISLIQYGDDINKEYVFEIKDLCDICGLDTETGGRYYELVKDNLKKIRDKSAWIRTAPKKEELFSWFDKVEMQEDSGTITVTFSSFLKPHLFELKDHFTRYRLLNVLAFQSKHAIRLFELLKSYESMGTLSHPATVEWYIEDLKKLLGIADTYPNFFDFDKRVLSPAIKEINTYSQELIVSYHVGKRVKRKAETVVFEVVPNHPRTEENAKREIARAERLDRHA